MSRKRISSALRKAVWINYIGKKYEAMCYTGCSETITVHNYECGHIIADSKGGTIELSNLRPVCSNCNKSMGNKNMEEFIKDCGFKKNNTLIKIINQNNSIVTNEMDSSEKTINVTPVSKTFNLIMNILLKDKEMAQANDRQKFLNNLWDETNAHTNLIMEFIEGIFNDICNLSNVSQNDLDIFKNNIWQNIQRTVIKYHNNTRFGSNYECIDSFSEDIKHVILRYCEFVLSDKGSICFSWNQNDSINMIKFYFMNLFVPLFFGWKNQETVYSASKNEFEKILNIKMNTRSSYRDNFNLIKFKMENEIKDVEEQIKMYMNMINFMLQLNNTNDKKIIINKNEKSANPISNNNNKKMTYQEFISKEIKEQKKKNLGLKNTEYLTLAAEEWNKYKNDKTTKKEKNIKSLSENNEKTTKMKNIKTSLSENKEIPKKKIKLKQVVDKNIRIFLSKLSHLQLQLVCIMINICPGGTKDRMINCIENSIKVPLIKIKNEIIKYSTFKYVIHCYNYGVDIRHLTYTNNKKKIFVINVV